MNVQPPDPQNDGLVHFLLFACNGLMMALIAVGAYIVNLYRQKVDVLEKINYVTREELDRKFDVLRDDRQRMHQENLDNMREIRRTLVEGQQETGTEIRELNRRVDDTLRAAGANPPRRIL